MPMVDVDGLRIAYERAGSGPPVVLLHGYVGDGPATWRPQLDDLSDGFTVIAWDAPGAGGSQDPPEDFNLDGYADCLAGFLRRLNIERAVIAGLSFGGIVALAFQRRHAAMTRALVLASAYAGWGGSLPPDVSAQRLAQALMLANGTPEAFVDALLPTMFHRGISPASLDAFRRSIVEFHPDGFRAMARASAEDVRDVLPQIAVPTLLVYGESDVRAPRPVRDDLHAAIPGSELVVLPDTGHVLSLEAPEELNAVLRSFLLVVHA